MNILMRKHCDLLCAFQLYPNAECLCSYFWNSLTYLEIEDNISYRTISRATEKSTCFYLIKSETCMANGPLYIHKTEPSLW